MKRLYLLIIIFLFVSVSVFSITNKDKILMLLQDYHEECLNYQQVPMNQTEYYCDNCIEGGSCYSYLTWCNYCKDKNTLKLKELSECNGGDISCNCPKIANRTIITYKDGKCIKYHLVREVTP